MFDKYHAAIKARPRPRKRAFKYTYDPATGLVTVDVANLSAMLLAREEASTYEEDLAMWYEQQGVSREPYLAGETLEAYKARTEKP